MDKLVFLDWLVLLCYAAFIIFVGVYTGRKEKNTEDYFLGGRRMPWWAVMISIYATSLSALTFVGVPGAAFKGDFSYLQLGIGDFFGRLLIIFLLLTVYYKGKVTTVYQYLGQRFGPRSHDGGTLFFLVTRLLASGVRLAGCAIALSVVFQLPLNLTIGLIAATALVYTMLGGIKAVIWTDTMQFALFMAAAAIALTTIITALPGGWQQFIDTGNAHGKFTVFRVSFDSGHPDYWLNFANDKTLIAGFFFGCLSTLAALGTDQDLVQRMLTCEKVEQSQKALLLTAILNFPISLLFLSVGAALFVYYQHFPNAQVATFLAINEADKIFPYFIKTVLAPGLRGLLIAGLFAAAMSSLDSALNALASTAYIDLYKRYVNKNASEISAVKISRIFVMVFAFVLAIIAMIFSHAQSILWMGFQIAGYTYGALLGIFLLAVLTDRKCNDKANLIAMITSVPVVILLTAKSIWIFQPVRGYLFGLIGLQGIAWQWAIFIGALWTFGLGFLFSETNSVRTDAAE